MLLLKIFVFCLISFNSQALLYGLDSANPLSKEELNNIKLFRNKTIVNYPQKMRDNIMMLSEYAKKNNPNFQLILHEGQELNTKTNYEYGLDGFNLAIQDKYDANFLSKKNRPPQIITSYLNSIDGIIKNNVFFKNKKFKYIKDSNANIINNIADIKNYWFALDDEEYNNKQQKIEEIINSNFDLIVINPMFKNKEKYTTEDVKSMQFKKNGFPRLVLAQIDLAEINPLDYRYKAEWTIGKPNWLARKSLVNEQDIITAYWQEEWQELLSRHFKAIVKTGYSGAFLTGADNHKYFETITPLE